MKRDWEQLHRSLEDMRMRLEPGYGMPEAEKDKVLRSRARLLGRTPGAESVGERIPVMEFSLARERYAAEIQYVREVHPMRSFCRLPCTPPFIVGIINIRGQILSVVDIKRLFGLPEKGITNLDKVLVTQSGTNIFGILVDAVAGMREVAIRDLHPPLSTLSGLQKEYIRGITRERLIVLHMENMLSDKRLVIHEEV
ncbi:MAG: chemotaxis protein CheW [Syntrophales bacterium]|nr:chemotaxis protein CheW [Syntrophales bacterium]